MTKKTEGTVMDTALFKFKKLFLSEDLRWSIHLVLKTTLPESFREYTFKFSLNEEPYQVRIDDLKKRKEEIKADVQGDLFPSEGAKKSQLKAIDSEIEDIVKELKDSLESTPEISFGGAIDKLEYKDGDTVIVFSVPASSVQDINNNRSILQHYKLELIRE